MRTSFRSQLAYVPSLPFILLLALFFVLFVAGGASRADVPGQVVVRSAATFAMVITILFGPRPQFADAKPVWIILLCCIILPALQLIPLPPVIWQSLPGRALFAEAATMTAAPQPWRPVSLVPGATVNALASLLVPLAILLLVSQLTDSEHRRLPSVILSVIASSMLIGLIQFSGLNVASPLGDNGPSEVSGFFANRNHFALLLAIGCSLAPIWAFLDKGQRQWRVPLALGLTIMFALSILSSGSRAGTIIGALGLVLGIIIAWQEIMRMLDRYSRWVTLGIISAILISIAAVTFASITADRAISINRLLAFDAAHDLRSRVFTTLAKMVETYFPAGIGYGGFDPLFRIHEPFELLSPTYLNHAHNDILEVLLDGGVGGLALLAGSLLWWGAKTFRAWGTDREKRRGLSRAGSAAILLTILASSVDYPARTPLVMAILVVAAAWLAMANRKPRPALPPYGSLL